MLQKSAVRARAKRCTTYAVVRLTQSRSCADEEGLFLKPCVRCKGSRKDVNYCTGMGHAPQAEDDDEGLGGFSFTTPSPPPQERDSGQVLPRDLCPCASTARTSHTREFLRTCAGRAWRQCQALAPRTRHGGRGVGRGGCGAGGDAKIRSRFSRWEEHHALITRAGGQRSVWYWEERVWQPRLLENHFS